MSGPTINRGASSGDIWTPRPFIAAVGRKFGPLQMDLAASPANACAPKYITAAEDSLQPWFSWHDYGLSWLNPPYRNITPWARKCAVEFQRGAEILLLVPGSIGANWYWDWVDPFAAVYSIGRLVFDNCFNKRGELVTTPYPKDLLLCHYNPAQAHRLTYPAPLERWRWQNELANLTKEKNCDGQL